MSTLDELMRAIEDNAVIVLEPGEYVIEDWLNEVAIPAINHENEKNLWFDSNYYNIYDNAYIGEVFDGYDLAVIGVKNLTIKAKEPVSTVEIVAVSRYVQVIRRRFGKKIHGKKRRVC